MPEFLHPMKTVLLILLIPVSGGLLAQWWFSTSMSESIWTWINVQIESGQNPGLASDIELLVTLICALLVSTAGAMLIRGILSRLRRNAGTKIH